MARLFLSDALTEPGLVDAATAMRIEADLMKSADPQAFNELAEFLGPVVNGQRDEIAGALPVTEYSMKLFRDFMDEHCGTNAATEAARAVIEKQLEKPGPAIEMSDIEAHDPSLYRLARDMAQEHGRVLTIRGPEGSSDLNLDNNNSPPKDQV
jgi:hypothetical protein